MDKGYVIRAFVSDDGIVNYSKEVITNAASIEGQGCTSIFFECDTNSDHDMYWDGIPVYKGNSRKLVNERGCKILQSFNLSFK